MEAVMMHTEQKRVLKCSKQSAKITMIIIK